MVARRVHGGKTSEIKTVALRAVVNGDLHEAGGTRVGIYNGDQPIAIGETMVLHCDEHLEVAAPSGLVLAIHALVNFDFATQEAVASGGTDVGRTTKAKATADLIVQVALNNSANAVA